MSMSNFQPPADNIIQLELQSICSCQLVSCVGPTESQQSLTDFAKESSLLLHGCAACRSKRAVALRTNPYHFTQRTHLQ